MKSTKEKENEEVDRSGSGHRIMITSMACFYDWKRFCFVLREIANGKDDRPLLATEAQKRAQMVLTECGYAWSGFKPVTPPSKPKQRASGGSYHHVSIPASWEGS